MNRIKKIIIFLLLVILTCCVVFIPQLISEQNEGKLLNKTEYRNYNAGNREKVTSEQVARLYHNQEISIDYNMSPINAKNSDVSAIQENVEYLVEFTFGKDKVIYNHIKKMLTDSSVDYSRNSNLIKIDNHPIALNFIVVDIKKDSAVLEILYEEKTKTIMRFSYDTLEKNFNDEKGFKLFLEKLSLNIKDYYENQLKLNEKEYYFKAEYPSSEINNKDKRLDIFYIEFGILQSDVNEDKHLDSFILNFE